jgi:hypothetical protein
MANRQRRPVKYYFVDYLQEGRRERTRAPVEGVVLGLESIPSMDEQTKDLHTKSDRPTLRCRVFWAWSEMVNLYSRQMILLRERKVCNIVGPRASSPIIFTVFPSVSLALTWRLGSPTYRRTGVCVPVAVEYGHDHQN